jgi:hypothetical protein
MNGKKHDNPLSDMTVHGAHPFPADVEEMLRQIQRLGSRLDRWPLGENGPFSPREFEWENGKNRDEARKLRSHLIAVLEAGRGDEALFDPVTRKPFMAG